jgi:hypothetical protein
VKETGARIVITSSLRVNGLLWLQSLMREQGGKKLERRTIGCIGAAGNAIPRGELVNDWRGLNGHTGPYVVLDNKPIIGHCAHFVLVDPEHGFKLAEKDQAAKLLGVK